MWYVYFLKLHNNQIYTGMTGNLKRRISEHNQGKVKSTKNRLPIQLLLYEAYQDRLISIKREKYLKSSDGHKDINKRFNFGEVPEWPNGAHC